MPTTMTNDTSLNAGDWVIDTGQESSDKALVLEILDKTADEAVLWETPPADPHITVASYNNLSGDDAKQPVAIIAFYDDIDDYFGNEGVWTTSRVRGLYDEGEITRDHDMALMYPVSRLQKAEL